MDTLDFICSDCGMHVEVDDRSEYEAQTIGIFVGAILLLPLVLLILAIIYFIIGLIIFLLAPIIIIVGIPLILSSGFLIVI